MDDVVQHLNRLEELVRAVIGDLCDVKAQQTALDASSSTCQGRSTTRRRCTRATHPSRHTRAPGMLLSRHRLPEAARMTMPNAEGRTTIGPTHHTKSNSLNSMARAIPCCGSTTMNGTSTSMALRNTGMSWWPPSIFSMTPKSGTIVSTSTTGNHRGIALSSLSTRVSAAPHREPNRRVGSALPRQHHRGILQQVHGPLLPRPCHLRRSPSPTLQAYDRPPPAPIAPWTLPPSAPPLGPTTDHHRHRPPQGRARDRNHRWPPSTDHRQQQSDSHRPKSRSGVKMASAFTVMIFSLMAIKLPASSCL
jgi:hypothetical protein